MESTGVERWVPLEGARNFRDLGGYPTRDGRRTRTGLLYRAGALGEITEGDRRRLREDLGIRTVLDLRREDEIDARGVCPLADEPGVRYLHVSLSRNERGGDIVPGPLDLGEYYLWKLENVGERFAEAFRLLADETTYPAVFHCTGGKDRTGMVAALVLDLCGVPEELVVSDYALTERARGEMSEEDLAAAFAAVRNAGLSEEIFHARPASMERFVEGLRERYGSAEDYLASQGIEEAELETLRRLLLEPSG